MTISVGRSWSGSTLFDKGLEGSAKPGRVLLIQVDLIRLAVQCETYCLLGVATVQIISQLDHDCLDHEANRILPADPGRGSSPIRLDDC